MAQETVRLARYAAGLRYEDIPAAIVGRAKECIADTVAAIICGAALPWSRIVVGYARRTGPGGSCHVLGSNGPAVSAPAAALANGRNAEAISVRRNRALVGDARVPQRRTKGQRSRR